MIKKSVFLSEKVSWAYWTIENSSRKYKFVNEFNAFKNLIPIFGYAIMFKNKTIVFGNNEKARTIAKKEAASIEVYMKRIKNSED